MTCRTPNMVLEGVNPSCGDDIFLKLKVENDEIVDGSFVGSGCAISQASADIMLELIIGKKKEEALHLADLFLQMIKGTIKEEDHGRAGGSHRSAGYFSYARPGQMCGAGMAHHGRDAEKTGMKHFSKVFYIIP